ncbi:hypothetical protein HZS55_18330 [Halosimplex rubrum]|uniref:Uncharacterized protein n=1 Tax=Halosimplex rubrum TaxID=869889 RepID=A0A7D5SZY8_9EURY|nr:hypothetical protein [Halosimplex rubrum]QLH79131.1 hypothetical protein HZS55_18330 [Halosimplex rubrum]
MSDSVDDARRTALRLTGLVVAGTGLSGCLDDSGGSGSADTTDEPGGPAGGSDGDDDGAGGTDAVDDAEATEETETKTGTETTDRSGDTGTSESDLDLREANVTAAEFESSDGAYRFSVTLYHDDDGEGGYANWWQVEDLDGERLGRRDLAHPHSTDPFTRSETIEVPAGVACVVVRRHDQTHEYGGRAMVVDLDSGETRAVDQGTDPESFDERDCP